MRYELKEAIVEGPRSISSTGGEGTLNNGYPPGNQFLVRVLPEMNDIEETDLLPLYPNFFQSDQVAYQKGDVVWIFCSDDFHVGYILSRAQSPVGVNLLPFIAIINTAESNAGLPLSGFNELTLEGASQTSIRFTNESTGQAGEIFNNKVVYLYGQNGEIWCSNPGMSEFISPDGDALMEAKSLTEVYSGDSDITIGGNSTETSTAKRIQTSGMMTLSTGGSRQDVTSANKSESILGNDQIVVGGSFSLGVGPQGITITDLGGLTLSVTGGLTINALAGTTLNTSALTVNSAGAVSLLAGAGISLNGVGHATIFEALQAAMNLLIIQLQAHLAAAGDPSSGTLTFNMSLAQAQTVTIS